MSHKQVLFVCTRYVTTGKWAHIDELRTDQDDDIFTSWFASSRIGKKDLMPMTNHHVVKKIREWRHTVLRLCITNLGTRWNWVFSFTLPPLDLREGTRGSHWMTGWGPTSVWTMCKKERCLWQESNSNPLVFQPLLYYTLTQLAMLHTSFQAVLYLLHSSNNYGRLACSKNIELSGNICLPKQTPEKSAKSCTACKTLTDKLVWGACHCSYNVNASKRSLGYFTNWKFGL